jgi:acetyl-CoA synthetase
LTRDLSRLLRPRSIAVLGGGWAANVVAQCRKMGFDGEVWPVHPTRAEIGGARAYPSLADLPGPPDATFIGVNRTATIDIVRDLAAMNAGGAVCFASGFAEAGDPALQSALVEAAGEMPVLGPNCYGLINYLDGALLWPDQHGGKRVDKGVAIIGQSSNILLNLTMAARGLPLAYVIAAGNQAQTDLSAIASGLLDDPRVTAIGLHIEGLADIAAFAALAQKARERKIPIVAIKIGRSEAARAATLTHTASLAGSEAAARAYFRRLGVPLLDSLPAFLETLKLLHIHGSLAGAEVASMSCSGGEAALMADTAARHPVALRPLTDAQAASIRATVNPLVTVANPFDYHTFDWGDRPRLAATFAAMMEARFDLTFLVLDFPRAGCDDTSWLPAVEALADAAAKTGSKAATLTTLPECLSEAWAGSLASLGLAPMLGADETFAAIAAAAEIGAAWGRPTPAFHPTTTPAKPHALDEAASKSRLAAHGLAIPASRRATPETAAAVAETLGFPVALKSLGVAHKTEANALRLNIRTGAEAEHAAATLGPDILVERMEQGVAELIIGVVNDPQFGLVMTIGAGGVLAELLADVATFLLPATDDEIRAAIASLRIAKLLNGWRGAPPADTEAAVAAARSIADFALANAAKLAELDVNPLIVRTKGAVAVDALIRMED